MTDLFDSTVQLEEQFISEGRAEGVRQGRIAGVKEGRELGVSKGFEIGTEVGFYHGTVQTWLAAQREVPGLFSERAEKHLTALKDLIDAFPCHPQDERLQDAMAELRGKFKTAVMMLGFKDLYIPPQQADTQF